MSNVEKPVSARAIEIIEKKYAMHPSAGLNFKVRHTNELTEALKTLKQANIPVTDEQLLACFRFVEYKSGDDISFNGLCTVDYVENKRTENKRRAIKIEDLLPLGNRLRFDEIHTRLTDFTFNGIKDVVKVIRNKTKNLKKDEKCIEKFPHTGVMTHEDAMLIRSWVFTAIKCRTRADRPDAAGIASMLSYVKSNIDEVNIKNKIPEQVINKYCDLTKQYLTELRVREKTFAGVELF